jgi:WD40 repeat protein
MKRSFLSYITLGLFLVTPLFAHSQDEASFIPTEREPIISTNAPNIQLLGSVGGGWWLRDADWSSNGQWIAVASQGGVLLYDADDLYAAPRVLDGHTEEVTAVAFSPDNQYLASASRDQTIRIWNIADGATVSVWQHQADWTYSAEYSPDGSLLAISTYSYDSKNRTLIFNVVDGHIIQKFEENWVGFASNADLYMRYEETIFRYSLPTGQQQILFQVAAEPNSVALSHDGNLIAATYDNDEDRTHSLQLWDKRTRELLTTTPLDYEGVVVFSSDDSQLVTYFWRYGKKQLWNVHELVNSSAPTPLDFSGPSLPVSDVVFSPDLNQMLLVGMDDNHGWLESELWLWNIADETPSATILRSPFTGTPQMNQDGSRVYYQGRIWDLAVAREIHLTDHTIWSVDETITTAYSIDEADFEIPKITMANYECGQECIYTHRVWNIETGEQTDHFQQSSGTVQSPDGMVQAILENNQVTVIDARSKQQLSLLQHDEPVSTAMFSPDSRKIVSQTVDIDADLVVTRLWDVASGTEIQRYDKTWQNGNPPETVFTPDSAGLLIWRIRQGIQYWDTSTGEVVYSVHGPKPGTVMGVTLSPDGKTIAVSWGDWTNIVDLIDAQTGRLLNIIQGFPNAVVSVFNQNGNLLAMRSADQIWLWDMIESKVIAKFGNMEDRPRFWYDRLQFSPDGRLLSAEYSPFYPVYYTELWNVSDFQLLTTLEGHNVLYTANSDLIATEDMGFVHLWGIPKD